MGRLAEEYFQPLLFDIKTERVGEQRATPGGLSHHVRVDFPIMFRSGAGHLKSSAAFTSLDAK